MILPFLLESPRWLAYQDPLDDALDVLALRNGGGNKENPAVVAEFSEIINTLKFKKEAGKKSSRKDGTSFLSYYFYVWHGRLHFPSRRSHNV